VQRYDDDPVTGEAADSRDVRCPACGQSILLLAKEGRDAGPIAHRAPVNERCAQALLVLRRELSRPEDPMPPRPDAIRHLGVVRDPPSDV
jgi:hypothetical protein